MKLSPAPKSSRRGRVMKSFKCSCGVRFSASVFVDKTETGCIQCKGIAVEYHPSKAPPVWKVVTERVATCPKCGNRLRRASGDAATMFDYVCIACHHAC